MTREYCEFCGAHVNTAEDESGEYESTPGAPYGPFRCGRCCEVRDAIALERGGIVADGGGAV